MTLIYVDTSALAKRYLSEVGSTWVKSWIEAQAGNVTVVSRVSLSKIASLMTRRHREKSISAADLATLYQEFLGHACDEYLLYEIDEATLNLSVMLLFSHVLRILDAIQLASALEVARILSESVLFVSADTQLLSVAGALGLNTDNPLMHP